MSFNMRFPISESLLAASALDVGMRGVVRPPTTTLRRATPEEVGMSTARIQHVAELGKEWVREGVAPAMVLLVAR